MGQFGWCCCNVVYHGMIITYSPGDFPDKIVQYLIQPTSRHLHGGGYIINPRESVNVVLVLTLTNMTISEHQNECMHDDVIKWKHFPRYWPFVRGNHRSTVNSPHKGLWRGAFMFSLICVWINGWVNNREAGDLRRYRVHYDVTVMVFNWLRASHLISGQWDRCLWDHSDVWIEDIYSYNRNINLLYIYNIQSQVGSPHGCLPRALQLAVWRLVPWINRLPHCVVTWYGAAGLSVLDFGKWFLLS